MRAARVAMAGVAAWLVLAVPAALAAPAAAQEPEPGSGGLVLVDQPATANQGTFPLVLQLPGILSEGDVLSVSVHERVEDMDDFNSSLVAEDLGGVLGLVAANVDELDIDAAGRVTVAIPLRDDGDDDIDKVLIARPGVYPLRVDLRDDDQRLVGRIVTHLVRTPLPEEASVLPMPVAVVTDLHAGPEAGTINVPDIGDVNRIREWVARLELHGVTGTVRISPWLLDAVGQQGLVRDLREFVHDRELVGAPLVRVDEAALARVGLGPSMAELHGLGTRALSVALGVPPKTDLWLSDGAPSAPRMDLLGDLGVTSAVLDADEVSGLPADATTVQGPIHIQGRAQPVDALVSIELDNLATATDPVLAAHRLLAELSMRSFDEDSGATLLFHSTDDIDPAALDVLLGGLTDTPLLRPTSAGDLLRRRPETLPGVDVRLPSTQPDPLPGDPDLLQQATSSLAGYRSMVFDDDARRLHQPLYDDLLLSLADQVDIETREATWRTATSRVLSEVAAVSPPPIDSIQLTSREGTLPFSFQNGLDYPVRVEVRFVSDQLTFKGLEGGETSTLVLEPGVTSPEFSVEALTSGSFPLSIEMRSPDGGLALGGQVVSVRSTALSRIAILLSVGAAAFLVVWWLAQLRRRRHRPPASEPLWVRQELPA
jgi:Family of unknown function (DUF6049)